MTSWTNYLWVWLAVHHLGYAWRDGRMGSPGRLLVYAALGWFALSVLIFRGVDHHAVQFFGDFYLATQAAVLPGINRKFQHFHF